MKDALLVFKDRPLDSMEAAHCEWDVLTSVVVWQFNRVENMEAPNPLWLLDERSLLLARRINKSYLSFTFGG